MKTYDELQKLIREGDPIFDPHDVGREEPVLREDGLYIAGIDDDAGFQHDLLIRIIGDQYSLSYRDPGTEKWGQTTLHDTYDDLHTWVYEL